MRPVLSRLASMTVLCLYQHRLMSTSQLHRLLLPASSGGSYLRSELARLRTDGLVDAVACGSAGTALWFVTAAGAELAEESGQVMVRPYRMTADRAAGVLKDHTLAVNEAGLAFAASARGRHDTCGPLDWTPEVAHRLGRGQYLICDALVNYVVEDQDAGTRTQLQWFMEIDRATMPAGRLAAKLGMYGRYRDGQGGQTGRGAAQMWRERYPVFPRLLIILAGASEAVLERRACDLTAVAAVGNAGHHRRHVLAGVTTLARLTEYGPFTPIFTPIGTATGDDQECDALLAPTGAMSA
jgi:hypothetical protein